MSDEDEAGDDAVGAEASPARLLESALAHPKRLLRSVVDNLPLGVFCKDVADDFRVILWNRKNAEITGIPGSGAIGKTDYDLFPREQADHFRADDERVMKEGAELEIPSEEISHEGRRLVLHTHKVPISAGDGGPRYLLGISEDITARMIAEEQLQRANEELESTRLQIIQMEKLESVGRLAAGVAHEVKNPLALILMGVEYLSEGIHAEDENVPVIIDEIRAAVHRADKIVRGLVDFSSERQLDLQLVSMNALVEQTLLMVRHELVKSNIEVETDYEEELPPVKVDKTKFEQVLVNLFMNAIHSMQDKTHQRLLKIRTWAGKAGEQQRDEGLRTGASLREGSPVVYTRIEDNGVGFPGDILTKVFDPFYTTKATGVGTGLGLTIVKKIVEIHHGQIEISGNKHGGATITLMLRQAS